MMQFALITGILLRGKQQQTGTENIKWLTISWYGRISRHFVESGPG